MKKTGNVLGLAAALLFSLGLAASAHAKSHAWTGWISDSACGAKGANAGAKDCTMKCVKQHGAKYVFVNESNKKVYAIANQKAVSESDLGHEVVLHGSLTKKGSIVASSITAKGM